MDELKEIPKEAQYMIIALVFVLAVVISVVIYVLESEKYSLEGDQTNHEHLKTLQIEPYEAKKIST